MKRNIFFVCVGAFSGALIMWFAQRQPLEEEMAQRLLATQVEVRIEGARALMAIKNDIMKADYEAAGSVAHANLLEIRNSYQEQSSNAWISPYYRDLADSLFGPVDD